MKLNQDILVNAKQAQEYLEKQGYALADAQGNRTSLSYTLLLLAHCAPPSILPKGMRAVATLLELETADQSAKIIATSVMNRINPLLDLTLHTTETIEETTKHTRQAADRMFNTCEEARDEIYKVTECAANDLSTTIESIKGDMDKIVKELHTATT